MRQMNLSVVMHHLREHAPVYRAQLAEMTGLNKTTVSSLVGELINQQFVHESGSRTNGGTGRPAVLLELNPAAGCAIAAEIAVEHISVAAANFTADVLWRHTESISPRWGQQAILDRLQAVVRSACGRGLAATGRLLGIAVGVPGLVDQASGNLLFAPNLGWSDVPLQKLLQEAIGVPVFVDNEANLAALGEVQFGAAQGHRDVLFISAGVGLGGGIVRDGELYRGSAGFAGEFGHMTIDPDGPLCRCGNRGCWEGRAGEEALLGHVQRMLAKGRPSVLAAGKPGGRALDLAAVLDAAMSDDPVALEALRLVGRDLGIGIASLVNALNPELVVLGGALSLAGEYLVPEVEEELASRALRWNRRSAAVVVAKNRLDACVMGGLATVLQAVLTPAGTAPVARAVPATLLERR